MCNLLLIPCVLQAAKWPSANGVFSPFFHIHVGNDDIAIAMPLSLPWLAVGGTTGEYFARAYVWENVRPLQ